ncbi:MAG: hypothetical protein J3R72DRAFT_455863 [Linnemannia gamsii]|nr:MAG: hypothetical protein J3R72DRAFT_455863 [Linnemannia gamsii]
MKFPRATAAIMTIAILFARNTMQACNCEDGCNCPGSEQCGLCALRDSLLQCYITDSTRRRLQCLVSDRQPLAPIVKHPHLPLIVDGCNSY